MLCRLVLCSNYTFTSWSCCHIFWRKYKHACEYFLTWGAHIQYNWSSSHMWHEHVLSCNPKVWAHAVTDNKLAAYKSWNSKKNCFTKSVGVMDLVVQIIPWALGMVILRICLQCFTCRVSCLLNIVLCLSLHVSVRLGAHMPSSLCLSAHVCVSVSPISQRAQKTNRWRVRYTTMSWTWWLN